MNIIRIKNTEEFAEQIVFQMSTVQKYISVFCFYEDAREIISDLIRCGCTAHNIELYPYSSNGYDDEFLISVTYEDEEYLVCCQPAKMDDGRYVKDYPTIAYVFEDCNSRILQSIKDAYIFEVAYDEEEIADEFECDGDCANCDLNDYHDDVAADYIKAQVKPKTESVKMDEDMKGFTISTSDTYGNSTFSFHSTDVNLVKEMLKKYGKF